MRILWVFDYLSPHWQQVASWLAACPGIQLTVLSRHETRPESLSPGVDLHYLACRRKVDLAARRALRSWLGPAVDVAHCYTSRNLANALAARPRGGPPVIGYRGTANRLSSLDPANWITFWHPGLAGITCVSGAVERALGASRISSRKLRTVLEGCDFGEDLAAPPTRREFDIPEGAFVVGTVATMRPVKGIDLLLRAALELADSHPQLYWLLIGEVADPRIAALAADRRIRGRVRLPGPRPRGGRYAQLFDLYAAPSRTEGFGISILEAMSWGVCPVATGVGGIPELIRHQIDGWLVPPESPTALSAAFVQLLEAPSLRMRLGASAAHRARTQFSIEAWGTRLLNAYRETLGGRAPRRVA